MIGWSRIFSGNPGWPSVFVFVCYTSLGILPLKGEPVKNVSKHEKLQETGPILSQECTGGGMYFEDNFRKAVDAELCHVTNMADMYIRVKILAGWGKSLKRIAKCRETLNIGFQNCTLELEFYRMPSRDKYRWTFQNLSLSDLLISNIVLKTAGKLCMRSTIRIF